MICFMNKNMRVAIYSFLVFLSVVSQYLFFTNSYWIGAIIFLFLALALPVYHRVFASELQEFIPVTIIVSCWCLPTILFPLPIVSFFIIFEETSTYLNEMTQKQKYKKNIKNIVKEFSFAINVNEFLKKYPEEKDLEVLNDILNQSNIRELKQLQGKQLRIHYKLLTIY